MLLRELCNEKESKQTFTNAECNLSFLTTENQKCFHLTTTFTTEVVHFSNFLLFTKSGTVNIFYSY